MTPSRILLIGAKGRMGQAISAAAKNQRDVVISASCDRGDALEPLVNEGDVVVDFSEAAAAAALCRVCVQNRKAMVIGTTGHSVEQRGTIKRAAEIVPIVLAPNFSVGVNALFWLTRKAAELLGPDFDPEVVEMHHRFKKDAPSGTAKKLVEILSGVRKLDPEKSARHGREGTGERLAGEIGIHALRGGDMVGEHFVIFAGRGERLELAHKASSRETFAIGALRAASWIIGRPAGLYGMEDVLGLSAAS